MVALLKSNLHPAVFALGPVGREAIAHINIMNTHTYTSDMFGMTDDYCNRANAGINTHTYKYLINK